MKATINDRLSWILFSDVNTRINLLVDECAHLRQTIESFVQAEMGAQPEEMRNDSTYYQQSTQERALQNLYYSIGLIDLSIVKNQNTFREQYESLLGSGRNASGEELYWFVGLRAHYISTVFARYLEHIEHAHQKLVQIVENMPGALPGPTLMRRWSNAGYGEFLSEYSRSINHEAQRFLWDMCISPSKGEDKDSLDESFEKWRNSQLLVHTWSYNPTSMTRMLRVKTIDNNDVRVENTIATIWSSYFYIDQPILFPLLYHECIHHYANRKSFPEDRRSAGSHGFSLWIDRREETAKVLQRLATFSTEIHEQTFWEGFVEEVWTDALSVALGGEGFLIALILQIIGLNNSESALFSDYEFELDEIVSLEEIGSRQRRIVSIPYPTNSQSYFWEARLRMAIKVYKYFFPESKLNNPDLHSWVDGLEGYIDAWYVSGKEVHSKDRTTEEHESKWKFRQSLNIWAESVIWSHIHDFLHDVKKVRSANTNNRPTYSLGDSSCGPGCKNQCGSRCRNGQWLVEKAFNYQCGNLFPKSHQNSLFKEGENIRLEDISIRIRWSLSRHVAEHLICDQEKEKWTVNFANYARHDGGLAFRLAYEWVTAKRDYIYTIGSILGFKEAEVDKQANDIAAYSQSFYKALVHSLKTGHSSDVNRELRSRTNKDAVRSMTAKRLILRKSENEFREVFKDSHSLLAAFNSYMADVYCALLSVIPSDNTSSGLGVGTLTFGVVRPFSIQIRSGEISTDAAIGLNGYANAIESVKTQLEKINREKVKRLKEAGFHRDVEFLYDFYPTLGEYSFVLFESYFTPSEKSGLPRDAFSEKLGSMDRVNSKSDPYRVKILSKPRSVLQVYKSPAIKDALPGFVRISQIELRYRWQWIELRKSLEINKVNAELFLSSAWENVVLITSHANLEDYHQLVTNLGLKYCLWQDIHSNFGLSKFPGSENVDPTSKSATPAQSNIYKLLGHKGAKVYDRIGRYDLVVEWTSTTLADLWNEIDALPVEIWPMISSINFSFRSHPITPAEDNGFFSELILLHAPKMH